MPHPRFTQGSTMRHIAVMSLSNAAGISALFIVDMLDLFFLSLLGEKYLAAAVGYASTVLFLTTSIGIGISIAAGALISKSIGEKDRLRASQYLVNISVLCLIFTSIIALTVWLYIPELLTLVGAKGEVHSLAHQFLNIMVPSMPVLALAMSFGAGLRAVGDAKRSMSSTLAGGAVNAVLDPVFIFMLDMSIEGAAIASVLARVTILAISAYGVVKVHKLICHVSWPAFIKDWTTIIKIALPAMLTNLAMPISSAFITRSIAVYGDGFVAGYAIIGRIIPVAFGVVFALSGAVGPIVGQNYGAQLMGRVRKSLRDAYIFSTAYILISSGLVFLAQDYLVLLFSAKGNAAELVRFFCTYIAVSFTFSGILFVANASFNNLGKPVYSTLLNWGRATLGTLPFIFIGSKIDGAYGILTGQAIGGILFAFIALYSSFKLIDRIERNIVKQKVENETELLKPEEIVLPCTLNPLSSECAQMCQIAEEGECKEELSKEAVD
ncbi:MATE family efflux transporter [Endozoicomonas sp. (ex Bugula neritina AB1)]|nr:MATE family efflux transporter [Endozoicomonas sp. (ex Bugula neritina AB1)]